MFSPPPIGARSRPQRRRRPDCAHHHCIDIRSRRSRRARRGAPRPRPPPRPRAAQTSYEPLWRRRVRDVASIRTIPRDSPHHRPRPRADGRIVRAVAGVRGRPLARESLGAGGQLGASRIFAVLLRDRRSPLLDPLAAVDRVPAARHMSRETHGSHTPPPRRNSPHPLGHMPEETAQIRALRIGTNVIVTPPASGTSCGAAAW